MGAGVVLAGGAGDSRGAVAGAGRGQQARAMLLPAGAAQGADDPLEHPGAAQVEPVQVRELPVGAVTRRHRRQPAHRGRGLEIGQEAREPAREVGGGDDAAHEVGLPQHRGQEVLARGLPRDRRAGVGREPVERPCAGQRREALVARGGGPVEREAERECGLAVLAGAHRPAQLGEPGREPVGGQGLERRESAVPALRAGVVPLAQLGRELEQPGEAVGPLEALASGRPDVGGFAREPLRRQIGVERRLGTSREAGIAVQPQQPHQAPVPVDRGVPVERAVERRGQLAGRANVGVVAHQVHQVVRVLAVDGAERQLRERLDGARVLRIAHGVAGVGGVTEGANAGV